MYWRWESVPLSFGSCTSAIASLQALTPPNSVHSNLFPLDNLQ